MSNIEAAFLDIDKTLVDEQGQLYPELAEPLDSAVRPTATTFITGRGYPRYTQAAEENPVLWAPGMPIGLENGGRIVDGTTFDNLHFTPLNADEHEMARDYLIDAPDLRFVSFHPREPRTKTVIWTPDPVEASRMTTAYARNANVFVGNKTDLLAAITEAEPCMITCKTYDQPLTHPSPELRTLQNGTTRNMVPAAANKGTAGLIIADMLHINLEETLAAGDDVADIPMLAMPGLGYPVLIGSITEPHAAELPPNTMYADHPAFLGSLLMDLAEQP